MSLIQHGNIPGDKEGNGRSRKKQKINSKEVDSVAKAKEEEEEKFLQRWLIHDKPRMLKLMKQYGAEMYEYDFDHNGMEFYDDITNEINEFNEGITDERFDLTNKIYDVMFVAGFRDDDDFSNLDFTDGRMISRTVKNGAITFFTKKIGGTDIVCGRIEIEKSFCSTPRDDDYYSDDEDDDVPFSWESMLQTNGMEFQLDPNRSGDRCFIFVVTNYEDLNCTHVCSASFQMISNSGVMDWIPTEYEPVNNPITLNHETLDADRYKSFMRNQIVRRYNGHDGWCPESSWLCNHMNLSHGTAHKIHSYMMHQLPHPQWTWNKDDILMSFDMDDVSWTTDFIARPRPNYKCFTTDNDEIDSDNDSDGKDTA